MRLSLVLVTLAAGSICISSANANCKKNCPPPPQNSAPAQQQRPVYQPAPHSSGNVWPQPQQPRPQRPIYQEQNQTTSNSNAERRTFQQPLFQNRPAAGATPQFSNRAVQAAPRFGNQGFSPSALPRTYHLNRSTTAVGDAHGLTVQRQNSDGSHTIANWQLMPNGQRQFEAYRIIDNKRSGTQTRLYTDGRRVLTGKDFTTEAAPGRISTTTYSNGLRSAALPDGKSVFAEHFANVEDKHGVSRSGIIRSVYYRVHDGRAVAFRAPVNESYVALQYYGTSKFAYMPWAAPDGYYDPFFTKLSAKLTVRAVCTTCDDGDVQIDRGWFSSSNDGDDDPAGLMADVQLTSGFEDGMDGDADDVGPDDGQTGPDTPTELSDTPPDPQTAALENQVDDLKNQVASAEAQNADLNRELGDQQQENGELKAQVATLSASKPIKQKIVVPSDVRNQMKKQVKVALAHQKDQQPLSIIDVIAAAKTEKELFQANKALHAERSAGGSCGLSTGDLLRIDQIPADSDKVISMKVVLANAGSCAKNDVIKVRVEDAQEMLNGFMKRLEQNTKHAHDAIVQAEQKSSKSSSG